MRMLRATGWLNFRMRTLDRAPEQLLPGGGVEDPDRSDMEKPGRIGFLWIVCERDCRESADR